MVEREVSESARRGSECVARSTRNSSTGERNVYVFREETQVQGKVKMPAMMLRERKSMYDDWNSQGFRKEWKGEERRMRDEAKGHGRGKRRDPWHNQAQVSQSNSEARRMVGR
jgi:hypothetical protein